MKISVAMGQNVGFAVVVAGNKSKQISGGKVAFFAIFRIFPLLIGNFPPQKKLFLYSVGIKSRRF